MHHRILLLIALTACWDEDDTGEHPAQDTQSEENNDDSNDNQDDDTDVDEDDDSGDDTDVDGDDDSGDDDETDADQGDDTDDSGFDTDENTDSDSPIPHDLDGDGYDAAALGGDDCDDENDQINPGMPEICSGVDEDCDGLIDDNDASLVDGLLWYIDADVDSYGSATTTLVSCDAPTGFVANHDDCDDQRSDVNPTASEICDGIDNDCNGPADDDDPAVTGTSLWFEDYDGDSFGDADSVHEACNAPAGFVGNPLDCDDSNEFTAPNADETCDGVDNNCDQVIDEDEAVDAPTWYIDLDGDTYGDLLDSWTSCDAPIDFVGNDDDCDDALPGVNPAATEVCGTTFDDDCNGNANDPGAQDCTAWWVDGDADGHGAGTSECLCEAEAPYVASISGDCDDEAAGVHAGAVETCSTSGDDDCDGSNNDVDAQGCTPFFTDTDGDGFGTGAPSCLCSSVGAFSALEGGDCDDAHADVRPDAIEVSDDGVDNNCDGFQGRTAQIVTTAQADLTVVGPTGSSFTGGALAAGDFDGDGQEDLLIGAEAASVTLSNPAGSYYAGSAFVVLGPVAGANTLLGVYDLRFSSTGIDDDTGIAVAAGDLDGDGIDDMLIGASHFASSAGTVHVIYGGGSFTGATSTVGDFRWIAESGLDELGDTLAVGDVDGDGYDDVLLSARRANSKRGRTYLFYGGPDRWSGGVDVGTADAMFEGAVTNDVSGKDLQIGDVDADGFADIVVGASNASTGTGAVYVFHGNETRFSGVISVTSADATITGEHTGDQLGRSIALADLDGDGALDLAMGAPYVDSGATESVGAAYVVYGRRFGPAEVLPAASADARRLGTQAWGLAGFAVSTPGDLDGDGRDELIIGAPYQTVGAYTNVGMAYLSFDPLYGAGSASDVPYTFHGLGYYANFGRTIARADFDGDDVPDILIGAPVPATSVSTRGTVYGYLGGGW